MEIYRTQIHPILPILGSKALQRLGEVGDRNVADKALGLAVCLAASTSIGAAQYLHLDGSETPMSPTQYSTRIVTYLDLLLRRADFSDRMLDRIRVLTLVSLYWEPPSRNGRPDPAELFSVAVSNAHSIDLYINDVDNSLYSPGLEGVDTNSRRMEVSRLRICMFAVDRLIACRTGRLPTTCVPRFNDSLLQEQPPCFRLFWELIISFEAALDLHRLTPAQPVHEVQNYQVITPFQMMVGRQAAGAVPRNLLGLSDTPPYSNAPDSRS